jgi:hypothetical protein
MGMCKSVLTLGAAIGIAAATISPTQAGMIGPAKLQIREPASLAEPVRARVASGVSRVSTVRAGGGVASGHLRLKLQPETVRFSSGSGRLSPAWGRKDRQ